ncbi:tRNA dihydrouridine synthase DusB [Peptoniphilus catoniae]|uniref:tRNA dihydrouridine synthase DusB n=1 Tax=Peptoniphilus catoniae TaxID=1660341 RepID=UPI0010FE6A0F|nr:tRNA dihydrouridine synthase DusB [Peptoniphilus catoniae]
MKDKIQGAILSPLAGYTDKAFREICSDMGAYMTVTEMVSAKALYYDDKKSRDLLAISPKEKNVAVQIFGDDPDIMGYVVREKLKGLGFNSIDINMGCPAPKIVKNNCGSALLKDPDLAYSIMKSVVENSTVPVSIKIRKGIDGVDSLAVVKAAEKAGISYITLHGRTREEYYKGKADWDYIKKIAQEVKIPLIGNGDVTSYEDAIEKINYSKVAGVSIGRGAIGNPFIFKEIYNRFRGLEYKKPDYKDRIEMALYHLDLNVKYKGYRQGILEMRKQFMGYFKSMPASKDLRDKINRTMDYEEVKKLIADYELNIDKA